MTITNSLNAQQLDFSKVKTIEHQLDDVMELIDTTELKAKLKEVEHQFQQDPIEINKARLGIIYHETALNLSFFSKTEFKGYAKKSYDQLSELFNSLLTTKELMPFIASYRASALSLVGAETKKLKLLSEAFTLFGDMQIGLWRKELIYNKFTQSCPPPAPPCSPCHSSDGASMCGCLL